MDNGKIQLHNVDFDDFIKAVDECKGDVYLETKDGDVLNLKSKLCQMLGLSTILKKHRGNRSDHPLHKPRRRNYALPLQSLR